MMMDECWEDKPTPCLNSEMPSMENVDTDTQPLTHDTECMGREVTHCEELYDETEATDHTTDPSELESLDASGGSGAVVVPKIIDEGDISKVLEEEEEEEEKDAVWEEEQITRVSEEETMVDGTLDDKDTEDIGEALSPEESTKQLNSEAIPKNDVSDDDLTQEKDSVPGATPGSGTEGDNVTAVDGESLPDCRNRRSYVCGFCNMKTINPREYLYHLKDAHGESIRIFECSRCTYASKTHQKLLRHNHMVHKVNPVAKGIEPKKRSKEAVFKPSHSKKTKAFPISRSPRESKSPRRFEEYEYMDDSEQESEESLPPAKVTAPTKTFYRCDQCSFTTFSSKVLGKHENKFHLKRKFFRCTRCNYATQVKARYTKHMKYHQLPIIKCEWCDFRTPYRWNLDRHNKNHTEEIGEHKCHLCNFTAPIKQSLTVHIANHHLTPEQIKEKESKRTIGICNPEDCIADEEMELLRMERDEDPDALELPPHRDLAGMPSDQSFTVSNIDMGNQEDLDASFNENGQEFSLDEPKRKKPKIKITLKKMKTPKDTFFQELNERHNFNEDFIHPDDVVHRHGNVYIKTEKCNLCSFKAPFQHEIQRHKKKVHGTHAQKGADVASKKTKKVKTIDKVETSESSSDSTSEITKRRYSLSSNSTDVIDNVEPIDERSNDIPDNNNFDGTKENLNGDEMTKSGETSNKDSSSLKKKSSFFDKLQERLSSSNVQNLVCQFCGHESKCLSESVRHQKLHLSVKNVYSTPSLSTRCQFCRHRCKTTDDLMNHLKSCSEARKNQISDNMTADGSEESMDGKVVLRNKDSKDTTASDDHGFNVSQMDNKHPMENKVFVWNNISNFEDMKSPNEAGAASPANSSRTPSESAFSLQDSDNFEEGQNDLDEPARKVVKRRVYRCTQCSFWSTTASRFHVHIVGHFNTKPYSCSECGYRSNWRWDITKHIKLKIPKDKNHRHAEICLADETGERNYEKYDSYLVEVRMDEILASRSEGGMSSSRRGRPKRNTENDSNETDSAKSSPCPTPLTIPSVSTCTTTPSTGPSTSKFPAPPKLMRAPNRQFTSSPGPPAPFGPINPAAQMMVETSSANPTEGDAAKKKFSLKPPPLVAMGARAAQHQPDIAAPSISPTKEEDASDTPSLTGAETATSTATTTHSGSNYQIITPQGALTTSLETLQLLAAGSTNLAKLKRQQKETGEGNNPELDAAVTSQMRLLLWLNCLAREAEQKENEAAGSRDPPISSIMQLVLDHEGNPEWKCLSCDFRDNEQETVVQHVRLAHSKKGPVSLVHAVHRCSVCGFAAGTKRHVQVHIENAHSGQGGIISRSEGQNVDPETTNEDTNRSFDCRLCPFTCKRRAELKTHLSHHTPRVDYVFKCMFCPYYVGTKNDLFSHLAVHGMEASSRKEPVNNSGTTTPVGSASQQVSDDPNARHFVCDLCPFDTRSRAKLMHHRQFHRPRGLAFSCPHCSYNVTRRHLLAQHLRIHGVSPTEGLEMAENSSGSKSNVSKLFSDDSSSFSRSKSPSPSLTITPISSSSKSSEGVSGPPKIDPNCLPTLSDELTKNLHDIPLVWVSRDTRFFKMFKCRHCPHVNLRKTNIQEHEKMHRSDGLAPGAGHACQFCSYICINAGVMSAHLKVHNGSIGKCHAIVDQALPNEEQLHMLAGNLMKKAKGDQKRVLQGDEKLLYYCQNCPGRFFFEKEVQIHSRFHVSNSKFTHHCSKCDFGARDESQILAHVKVHTPEYQERTRTLMSMHPSSPSFPPVAGLSVPWDSKSSSGIPFSDDDNAVSNKGTPVNGFSRPWLTSPTPTSVASSNGSLPQPPPTSRFKCDQCPSTFSKLITLQYHQSLHSADNPFRCNRCTYAAKTQDGLQQHLALHERADLEKSSSGSFFSATPSPVSSPSPLTAPKKSLEETLGSLTGTKMKKGLMSSLPDSLDHPPIKLKFIGLKGASTSGSSKKQFKYYIEEQVPLSGVELLKRKNQIEREMPKDTSYKDKKTDGVLNSAVKSSRPAKPDERSGNPQLFYPLHIDKSSGRSREKRYKCLRCPSAFEKMDQFNVHLNLHGSNYKYKCRICDYSVKFYANFMMHIKRHKYHEKMDAQKKGLPPPLEDQMKYEPVIGENAPVVRIRDKEEILAADKENQLDLDAYPDMTTAEKQQIILQHKKSDSFKPKEEDKDKKVFYCQYCPYANMRRDAVDSHSLRHQANMGRGLYQCNFCDYTASQPNFIREHTRVHFRPFKYVQPEGFMRHDKMEVWSIFSGESINGDDAPKKSLVFSHEEGDFLPTIKVDFDDLKVDSPITETPTVGNDEESVESQNETGILVDFRSGDVVDAPSDFIIPLRPSAKSKATLTGSTNPSSFYNTGKHKSTKHLRARKKTKLESRAIISDLYNQEEKVTKLVSVGDRGEYSEQKSAFSQPVSNEVVESFKSYSESSELNGDIVHENGYDTGEPLGHDDLSTQGQDSKAAQESLTAIVSASH